MRNNGHYEQLKYHFWGYSKVPGNPLEYPPSQHRRWLISQKAKSIESDPISERLLRPRFLCVLGEDNEIAIQDMDRWAATHKNEPMMKYIFVSYTIEQFNKPSDWDELHRVARDVALRHGVQAYWIGCSCMPDETTISEDVHRISDVVRGADSLVIIIGPSNGIGDERDMLRHWGRRLWTFPEVLLSPPNREILVYTRGSDIGKPWGRFWKRNFPVEAWDDAHDSRQLVDHYEGSIKLDSLELVTIALRCLQNRDTVEWSQGDLSYALMGLLRRRPKVVQNQSGFQAFCRLSLANSSDRLLERLICLLPTSMNQQWHTIDDFWTRKL